MRESRRLELDEGAIPDGQVVLGPVRSRQPVLGDQGEILDRQGVGFVDVDAMRVLEARDEVVEEDLVEVGSSEVGVSPCRPHRDVLVVEREYGDVERTAAQIDDDAFGSLGSTVVAEGDRRSRGFGDESEHPGTG